MQLSPEQLTLLQQLASPALPIGGFSYSQGLEAAVELGLVHDEASAAHWIQDQLHSVIGHCEAPLWALLHQAWQAGSDDDVRHWNRWFFASRETKEIRNETEQMGVSLYKLALELDWLDEQARTRLKSLRPLCLPTVHAAIAQQADLPVQAGLNAYLYTWLENQVMAAIKSVPLGQVAGQRVLSQARRQIPDVARLALERSQQQPPALQTFAPQFSIVSARHESQFSRLFRS